LPSNNERQSRGLEKGYDFPRRFQGTY